MVKVGHKVNHGWAPDRTDPAWAERVEREAERTSQAAAHSYAKAQERLANAKARAEQEQHRKRPDQKRLARLWAAVEDRRSELLALQRQAQASPAGSQNRGKGSHRGISLGEPL